MPPPSLTGHRFGIRTAVGAVTAAALLLLILWPHVPTSATRSSATTLRGTAQVHPGESLTLISDMPAEAVEAVAASIEEQSKAVVSVVSTTGVKSGDSPLASVVPRVPTTPGVMHVVIWVGWGDLWGERLGFRSSAAEALGEVRERFPSASVTLVGPVSSEIDDARRVGSVDVMLGRAARAAEVTYVSGLCEGWSAVSATGALSPDSDLVADKLISAMAGD